MRYEKFQEDYPGIWVYIKENYLDFKDFELSEHIEKIYDIRLDPEKIRNIRRAKGWKKKEVESNKNDFKKIVFSADEHAPFHDERLFNLFCDQFLRYWKPDIIIKGGDLNDYYDISKFSKNPERKNNIQEEFDIAHNLLKRICKVSPNSKKRLIRGNHECFDEQTEILTKAGWKKYNQLSAKEIVGTYNQQLNQIEWQEIIAKKIQRYTGSLFHLFNRHTDLFITPEHRMLFKPNNISAWRIKPLKSIPIGKNRIYIRCASSCNNKEYDISDDKIMIVAWFITDGGLFQVGKYKKITFYQRKSKVHLIKNILNDLRWEYRYIERDRRITNICGKLLKNVEIQCEIALTPNRSRELAGIVPKKYTLPGWVYELSDRQFDVFLTSLIDGDGSRHKSKPDSSWMLYGKRELLEQVQRACFLHNYRTSLSTYRDVQYRLNITPNKLTSFYNMRDHIEIVKYNGMIWDVQTPNDTVIVRRNYKISITGNSRLTRYLWQHPEIAPLAKRHLNIPNLLELEKLNNITYHEKGFDYRGIYFQHGTDELSKHSGYSAKLSMDKHGCNIVRAHSHRGGTHYKTTWRKSKPHHYVAHEAFCMCRLNPEYVERPNWQQGWICVYIDPNSKYFQIVPVCVVDYKFEFEGKMFVG